MVGEGIAMIHKIFSRLSRLVREKQDDIPATKERLNEEQELKKQDEWIDFLKIPVGGQKWDLF